jgi:hypothetical protein
MKIRTTDVFSVQDTLCVEFSSLFGNGIAFWHGTKPNIGDVLDVELELDEVFSWKENIYLSSDTTPKITVNDGIQIITGELINDADGCAVLKIGDSVILVELDQPMPHELGFVDVRATAIHLYPTNI